jgi:hypothetical protein
MQKPLYFRLEEIQKLLWKGDDRIDQEDLFDLQRLVAALVLEVAQDEHKVEFLLEAFPWLYDENKHATRT